MSDSSTWILEPSNRKDKRFRFYNDKQNFHFGSRGANTYIDSRSLKDRDNYLARHSKLNEDWDSINSGSLSRYLLWGNSKRLLNNIADYERKFNIKVINRV